MLSASRRNQQIESIPLLLSRKGKTIYLWSDPNELSQSILRYYKIVLTPEEISSKIHRNNIFTVVDTDGCYWHIELSKSFSLFYTFNTLSGRFKSNKLPTGLSFASDRPHSKIVRHFRKIFQKKLRTTILSSTSRNYN